MINTRIIEIDPRELKLLKMNARFMRHEEFQRADTRCSGPGTPG